MDPLALVLLLGGGLVAGIINSIAGGGSLITLPLLIFAGLPPTLANSTNRVAVAAQCLAGLAGYNGFGQSRKSDHRRSHISWNVVGRTALPAVAGSVAGAFVASSISDETFRPILGLVLLLMAGVLLVRPARWLEPGSDHVGKMTPGLFLAFFLAGVYGGFIQAGVGFMLLAALVPGMGLDLVRANAVKVALVLILTTVALVVFVAFGQIDWRAGGVLAIGTSVGGYIGARLAIVMGARWIRWVLLAMVVLSAVEILGLREWLLRLF